jgi:hypothetical protein
MSLSMSCLGELLVLTGDIQDDNRKLACRAVGSHNDGRRRFLADWARSLAKGRQLRHQQRRRRAAGSVALAFSLTSSSSAYSV